ncbi:MAG: LTA synthase family protein [Planctomycetota bacterium]|nr:LTA synthase family protein [Planctomycetota bacterium]
MPDESPQPRSVGHGVMTAYVLLTPLFWRFFLLWERSQSLRSHDIRGVLSDLAIGMALVVGVTIQVKLLRRSAFITLPLWCLLHYGIYEHIVALAELPRIRGIGYLFDRTFVMGSVLHVTHPMLLFLVAGLGVVIGWRLKLKNDLLRRLIPAAVGTGVLVLSINFWPLSPKTMMWRQRDAINVALSDLLEKTKAKKSDKAGELQAWVDLDIVVSPEEKAIVDAAYASDLSGTPRSQVEFPTEDRLNVLLILVEGVCGAHIESVRKPTGISSHINLPFLDRLARTNMSYHNFVAHQRQTNRGEYSILAGDLPRLATYAPKMTDIAKAGQTTKPFLPETLKRHGYRTAYYQAAPLDFMNKDRFMPVVGFETVVGDGAFAKAYARNEWGVDDLAFYEQTFDMLMALNDEEGPWFATLLTVGTHHPFIIPGAYEEMADLSDRVRAFYYADSALEWLWGELEQSGILDDTLVIVTSDESGGLVGRGDAITKRLSMHWGFAIVSAPGVSAQVVKEPFGQSDIALSIMDYLGLTDEASAFMGRSLFRSYEDPRPLFIGNTYGRCLGVFDSNRIWHVYDERLAPLFAASSEAEAIFAVKVLPREPDVRGLVYEAARRSMGALNDSD